MSVGHFWWGLCKVDSGLDVGKQAELEAAAAMEASMEASRDRYIDHREVRENEQLVQRLELQQRLHQQ